jgi:hypothetical protein
MIKDSQFRRLFRQMRWWCNAAGFMMAICISCAISIAITGEQYNIPYLIECNLVVALELIMVTLANALWKILWTGIAARGVWMGLFYLALSLLFVPITIFIVPTMIRVDYERLSNRNDS